MYHNHTDGVHASVFMSGWWKLFRLFDYILIFLPIYFFRYTFYDGPPFATGLPHYGHILAGTIKDIVTRFAHQSGFHVDRRFGWDCHGLPVVRHRLWAKGQWKRSLMWFTICFLQEYEIDKTLGIKGPDDVAKMGIAEYNKQCRSIVMRYSKEWEVRIFQIQSHYAFDAL